MQYFELTNFAPFTQNSKIGQLLLSVDGVLGVSPVSDIRHNGGNVGAAHAAHAGDPQDPSPGHGAAGREHRRRAEGQTSYRRYCRLGNITSSLVQTVNKTKGAILQLHS